jgi:tetratricopeptide (TPR) repeat protein
MDERHRKASELALTALDLAIVDRLDDAEAAYRAAVDEARKVNHYSLSDYETQLAGVLARRRSDAEAEDFYRRAIADALSQEPDESSPSVGIARYFFAEFLVSRDRGAEALELLAPALAHAKSLAAILRLVEAEALWTQGHHEAARDAANRALAFAKTEEQREQMRERLGQLDGWAAV